jgi:sortase A
MRLAKVLGALGRSCITVGTLLLLFVAYQLWGTGIREAQAQTKITKEFHKTLDDVIDGSIPDTAAAISAVPEGEPTAIIDIPKINVHKTVVEGVGIPDLKKGPGHYPGTPLPGQKGNAAIAGHRTTYGAPFNRIDELKPGDTINVQTVQGKWRYVVKETQIVKPTQVEVLEDKGDNRLTLTACHHEDRGQPQRRAVRCVAGRAARHPLRRHLGLRLGPRPHLEEVALLRAGPALLHGGAVLLLRGVQPAAPREFLISAGSAAEPGGSPKAHAAQPQPSGT